MTNIGVRPTVDQSGRTTVETHIFDFDRDLYGAPIRVGFVQRLRDERAFESLELLQSADRRRLRARARAVRSPFTVESRPWPITTFCFRSLDDVRRLDGRPMLAELASHRAGARRLREARPSPRSTGELRRRAGERRRRGPAATARSDFRAEAGQLEIVVSGHGRRTGARTWPPA